MHKSPRRSKVVYQAEPHRLLQRPDTGLTPRQRSGATKPETKRQSSNSTLLLVFGLLLLQGIMLLTALVIVASSETQPGVPDTIAALDVPSAIEPQLAPTAQPTAVSPISPTQNGQPSLPGVQPGPPAKTEPLSPPRSTILRLRGMEITQGIQVFQEPENPRCNPNSDHPHFVFCNNSMPMVAGRHTLVRVYLSCNQACPTGETLVRLRLLKDGQEQTSFTRQVSAATLQRVTHLTMYQLRFSLDNSANFEFFPPPAWLSGQLTFEVETIAQEEAEKSPAQLSLTKEFAVRKPLRVAYLPIEYQGLRPPDPVDAAYWLQRMYPVPAVEYYRLPIPDLTWEGEVSKGEILRKLLYAYWLYALYQPDEARPDQLFGWLPQELYNGGASDPFWCPGCAGPHSSRVAFGGLRPEQDIGGPRILVHEIAHNLGAQHAWSPTAQEDAACFKVEGANIQVDPDWPYATTPYIQEFGIDLYSNPPTIYPPTYYDMMAYCAQPWISPHTYRKIFTSPFLQPDGAPVQALSNFQPQIENTGAGTLLVSGVVYPDGSVTRPEIIRLEGDAFAGAAGFEPPAAFTPPPGDDYCLEIQAKDGAVLSQHCFEVGFMDLENSLAVDSSPFFFTLPNIKPDEVGRVTIRKHQAAIVTVTPSNNPPEVTLHFPNGGETLNGRQTISWDAHDPDGDTLRYDLLYSPDAGQRWLPLAIQLTEPNYSFETSQMPASNQMLIRVVANDGFLTTTDESDGLFAIQTPAANSISLLGPSSVEPGQTFEVAVVAHQVSDPGLFGVQFKLNFDPQMAQVNHIRANPALDLVIDETIQNEGGYASFVASRRGQVANLTGEVTLATLTVTAAHREGQFTLELSDLIAGARGGLPLNISELRGLSIRVGP